MHNESSLKLGMAKAQDPFCFQWVRATTSKPGRGEAEIANRTVKKDRWEGRDFRCLQDLSLFALMLSQPIYGVPYEVPLL